MATIDPHSDYLTFNLPTTDARAVLDLQPTLLTDIPSLFSRISGDGDLLAAGDSGVFTGQRQYRYTGENFGTDDAAQNHLQGLLRIERGNTSYLLATAGDSSEVVSQVMVMELASRQPRGPWGSNLITRGSAPDSDGIVRMIALDRSKWHAGGIGWLGDVISIPLEGKGVTEVRFFHLQDPRNPTQLPITIDRPQFPNAGATALARMADGRIACLVWKEVRVPNPIGRIDCYLSNTTNLLDGFGDPETVALPAAVLTQLGKRDPQYQTISVLHPEASEANDTLFYLMGAENDAGDSPFRQGTNFADLFRIPAANIETAKDLAAQISAAQFVVSRQFRSNRSYCNFDAASCIYIDNSASQPRLHLYSAYHWRERHAWHLSEFAGAPDPSTPITSPEEGWIELYEDALWRGRRLVIHGTSSAEIADYARIFVQDGDFNERVSSARWQIPDGSRYRLYRDSAFQSAFFDLIGNGLLREIPDFSKRNFGDCVTSSQYV